MRKIALILFLVIFSCSKDKDVEEVIVNYSLSIASPEGGTVNDSAGSYESGTNVTVIATPSEGYVFIGWSGASTSTFSEIEITMDSNKSLTPVFEQQIPELVNEDNVFIGTGRWKIRKPKEGVKGSGKSFQCDLLDIIFRSNGSFTIITSTSTITGQFTIDNNTTITLNQKQTSIGVITNIVITSSFVSFSITLDNKCDGDLEGDKDDTYDPNNDPNALTYIPDDNFEQELIDLGYDDVLDDYVLTKKIQDIDSLNLSNKNISSAVGIEDFKSVESLFLVTNNLKSINVTKNINLKNLYLGRNELSTINLSENIKLEKVSLIWNKLTSIDVSKNTQLSTLFLQSNDLTILDVSNNLNLKKLSVGRNKLERLDLSNNINLEYLNISGEQISLSKIDLTNLPNLKTFKAQLSNLICIKVTLERLITLESAPALGIIIDWEKNTTGVYSLGCTDIILDNNGITVKCPESKVGDFGVLNGKTYEVVDNIRLKLLVDSDEDVTCVCTSNVTLMGGLFKDLNTFNQDIGNWDTSNVTDMNRMFFNALAFNQNIENWDTSKVTDMSYMFESFPPSAQSHSFNKPLNSWDVSNVVSFEAMFYNSNFNQDIGMWNISNAKSLRAMFEYSNFNFDIGGWNTSSVTSMHRTFSQASYFNQDISKWNTSNVSDMEIMFDGATNFNQNITGWCVTNITSEPDKFATNSGLQDSNKPIWGTCPTR